MHDTFDPYRKWLGIPPNHYRLLGVPLFEDDAETISADDSTAEGDEKPQVEVTLTHPLYVGETEVTQGQWQAVMNTTPWKGDSFVKEGADYQASYITWDDTQKFCATLSDREGLAYRLLSEAEWEYACRAGTTTKYHFGDDAAVLGSYAWFATNAWAVGEGFAHEVAKKQPNPFGLYDMHGNVWEWCEDVYAAKLPGGVNPAITTGGSYRVLRGGGWYYGAASCRSADRASYAPSYRSFSFGFRVVLVPFSQASGASE